VCVCVHLLTCPLSHQLSSTYPLQVAAAHNCRCFIAMPDDAAVEKVDILRAMGGSCCSKPF